jgi:multiple sugar transport system ATP-binding protein
MAIADGLEPFAIPDLGTTDGAITVCVRPGSVHVGPGTVEAKGPIRLVEYLGNETLLHVDLSSGQTLLVSSRGHAEQKAGDAITIGFDLADLHYFDKSGQRIEPSQA